VNTRASKNAEGVYSTADGRSFEADVVYMTVGGKPNTQFLRGGIVPLTAKGFIEVYYRVLCVHIELLAS
jgi:NADPH-dependent 2,4-dienoyl-CoA reductase/sulfur reductase-like enzyme